MRVRKHWKKQLTVVDPLDFSPGLLRLLTLLELNYWGRSPIEMKRMGLRPHVVAILSTSELLARGFDLDGTAGDDQIVGTNTTDRIQGFDGNDTLDSGERMRWRLIAANDEVSHAWRVAA